MPLIHFDMLHGRTPEQITTILDVSHEVFVRVLDIPLGDRYQIVTQHYPYEMVIKDTGLGFERSDQVIIIHIFSKQRSVEQKTTLYQELVSALQTSCQIDPKDIMISFSINEDSDWSFGFGTAQFLTGEL